MYENRQQKLMVYNFDPTDISADDFEKKINRKPFNTFIKIENAAIRRFWSLKSVQLIFTFTNSFPLLRFSANFVLNLINKIINVEETFRLLLRVLFKTITCRHPT